MDPPEILFCDNHILVANKPSGITTQPHSGVSLEEICKFWLKKKFNKAGNVFLQPIHRLDKPVSGVTLFARTSKALSRLQEHQRERLFSKTYLAVVTGKLMGEKRLEHKLVHSAFKASQDESGKISLLNYRALKNDGKYTLLKILLQTGRYHQIRAQLSLIGHPIFGDQKYGSHEKTPFLLHHFQLEMVHPISKTPLTWRAPLPFYWPAFFHP